MRPRARWSSRSLTAASTSSPAASCPRARASRRRPHRSRLRPRLPSSPRNKWSERKRTPESYGDDPRTRPRTGGRVTELLQHIVDGVSLGAIYALIALGYTMVYGVLQ